MPDRSMTVSSSHPASESLGFCRVFLPEFPRSVIVLGRSFQPGSSRLNQLYIGVEAFLEIQKFLFFIGSLHEASGNVVDNLIASTPFFAETDPPSLTQHSSTLKARKQQQEQEQDRHQLPDTAQVDNVRKTS